jgi:LPXTG-motif cell wall-anchored protein
VKTETLLLFGLGALAVLGVILYSRRRVNDPKPVPIGYWADVL